MAPKRKGGGKAAAGKQQRQQSLSEHDHFPLISKPATTIGKQIKVPGSHWEGRLAEDEENTPLPEGASVVHLRLGRDGT